MPIIYTYPSVVPKISDLVLLSTTNSDDENITANASIASIKDVIDVVDNLTAGSGISVSNPTGDITIGNTGILSLTAGNNVSLSGSNDNITISAQAAVNSISDFNGNNSLTGAVKIGSTSNVNVTFNTGTNKIDLSVLADISAGTPFSDSVIPVINGSNELIDSPMQVSGDDLIMKRYIRHLGDNGALFGFNTDSEFLIYTESNDQESLRITPTGTAIKTNATNRFTTTAAGATELYYAGSKKFETTTTGSTLTGGLSLSDGTNNVTISIPTITTSYDLKMPASIGAASQVLKLPSTIGSSPYQLTWGDASGGGGVPGGNTGSVQFKNSSSEFAGDAGFTFTNASGLPKLTIGDTTQDTAGIIEIQSDENGGVLKIGGGSQTYYTSIKGSDSDTANYDIILPPAGPGGNNKILESTSAGVLSWIPTPGVTSTNNVTASANSLNLQGSSSVAPTYGAPLNISSSGGTGSGNQTAIYIDQAATANASGSQGVKMNFKVASIGILITNADSQFAQVASFKNASNQVVGAISCTSSATTYATSSDYRIKENVVDMTGAVDRVKQLKPSRFNFTANPSKVVDGFLAHEAQEVVPESVTGVKDALYPDGDPLLQGIDQSKIVPLLTGAIKELIARIEVLEAK